MEPETSACEYPQSLLSRGLDGDLSRQEMRQLCAHTARCERCRQAMGELAAVDEQLHALYRPVQEATLDEGFHQAFLQALGQQAGLCAPDPVQLFGRQIAHDAALRAQLRAAANEEAFVALYVQLGRSRGYQFQAQQVAAFLGAASANEELNDQQLEQVAAAGVAHPFNGDRWLDWLTAWASR